MFLSLVYEREIQIMIFQHYDLGQLQGGETIEVTLVGNAANVKLMDRLNFQNYKNEMDYKYYGGHIMKSPFMTIVPNSGHWFITIDLGGFNGNVSSSVRVL